MAEKYYNDEKKKILDYLDEMENLKGKYLDFLIVKLQEIRLELSNTIDMCHKENKLEISNYLNEEFKRRDNIWNNLPFLIYSYMSNNNFHE